MLVLSRKKMESIVIGNDSNQVVICVVEITGNKVRIGITAPPTVPVHRKEVHDAITGTTPTTPATTEPVQRREAGATEAAA